MVEKKDELVDKLEDHIRRLALINEDYLALFAALDKEVSWWQGMSLWLGVALFLSWCLFIGMVA